MKILSNKKARKMLQMVAANYFIGADALTKADMPEKDFLDGADKLIGNTMDIASILYGKDGVEFINNTAIKYGIRGL